MKTSTAEKEWLRRISGGKPVALEEKQTAKETDARPKHRAEARKRGQGFDDVAGMDSLKQMAKEGFLQGHEGV